jgi:hypothetical protein
VSELAIADKTEPQHVVQFRVQYRYATKGGNSNPTEGYKFVAPPATTTTTTNVTIAGGITGSSSTA